MHRYLRKRESNKTKINKGERKQEEFQVVRKGGTPTSGADSNLETQGGLSVTKDHIICSQGRGCRQLVKYHTSGALWERILLGHGCCLFPSWELKLQVKVSFAR